MHVCIGVRVEDIDFPSTRNDAHPTLEINKFRNDHQDGTRRPMAACLGPALKVGNNSLPRVRPRVDRDDPVTTLTGVVKRFAIDPPRPEGDRIRGLHDFVHDWLRDNLTPLSADVDFEFIYWINETNYNQTRRNELSRVFYNLTSTPAKSEFLVKMFVKDEGYDSFKNARGINSRSDEFKVRVGPIFKLIEKEVFKLPCFIKKIPINERVNYIKDMMGIHGPFMVSDYTAFESLFTKEIMSAVEMQLYQYMTSELPDWWFDLVSTVLLGTNRCESKRLTISILCKRMSGEMCTSLGNGFSNWMFINYVCSLKKTKVIGVVEGDDGLFRLEGDIPTVDDFKELGLVIKLEVHATIGTTSFCGMLFHEDAADVLADPKKILAEFGWFSAKYRRARSSLRKMLIRAKSYSLRAQYPNAPIVRSLAEYGLRMTRSYSHLSRQVLNSYDTYKREEFMALLKVQVQSPQIHTGSRILVEQLFEVSISEQLAIEDYLNTLDAWDWNLPIATSAFPTTWGIYGEDFVVESRQGDKYPFAPTTRGHPELFPWFMGQVLRV